MRVSFLRQTTYDTYHITFNTRCMSLDSPDATRCLEPKFQWVTLYSLLMDGYRIGQTSNTKQRSPLLDSLGPCFHVRMNHTSKSNLFLELLGEKRDEKPAEVQWIFTIYSENLSPILQSLLPQNCLRALFVNPTGALSTSQDLNYAYFRLLVFLVANNFPDMSDRGIKAILQQLRGKSPRQLETFFHSIAGPTSKALAENLYRHAIIAEEETIVEAILMSQCLGVDANGKIDAKWDAPLDSCKNPAMAKTFLRHQARFPKIMSERYKDHALRLLISPRSIHSIHPCSVHQLRSSHFIDTDLLRQLLNAGAKVTPELLDDVLNRERYARDDVLDSNWCPLFDALLNHLPREEYISYHRSVFYFRHVWGADYATCVESVEHMINTQADLNELASLYKFDPYFGNEAVIDLVGRKGYLGLVRNLLRAGARLTEKSLVYAIQSGCVELVQYLIDHGADVHFSGEYYACRAPPLAEAIRADHTRIIRVLLQNNALSFRTTWEFCKVMEITSASGNMELTRALLAVAEQGLREECHSPYSRLEPKGTSVDLDAAIQAGHNEIALLIIHSGIAVSNENLTSAIEQRNMPIIQALLDTGRIDIGWGTTGSRKSILEAAVSWGDHALVEDLLSRGLNMDDYELGSSLKVAVREKDKVLVRILLDAGAIIKPSALWAATMLRDVEMVQYLLQYGADADNSMALREAILLKDYELVRVLLGAFSRQYPSGKRTYGTAAFIRALDMDDTFWMECLIDKVDLTARESYTMPKDDSSFYSDDKLTPLGHVIDRSTDGRDTWITKMRFLLNHGVSPYYPIREPRQGKARTPLLRAIRLENIPMINLLLEFKVDINHSNTKLNSPTPLQYAAKRGNLDIVRLLVSNGAKVNSPPAQKAGGTALQLAAREGRKEIVSFLLENNANVNASPSPSNGGTALQLAAIKGYIGIVLLLLERGADINASPSPIDGRTALEGAAEWGRLDTVKFLLDAGVDISSDNGLRYLRAAKRRARRNGFNAIVDLLEAYHQDPGPQVQAVFTDREGCTFWAVETDDGYEAWKGDVPTTQDRL